MKILEYIKFFFQNKKTHTLFTHVHFLIKEDQSLLTLITASTVDFIKDLKRHKDIEHKGSDGLLVGYIVMNVEFEHDGTHIQENKSN
jgi:hypothetical protein